MIARTSCLAAAFCLALLAAPVCWGKSASFADGMGSAATEPPYQPPSRLAEIHMAGPLKSLTLVSVSRDGMEVYQAELGPGHIELNFISLDRDGRAKLRSFDMRY